MAEIYRALVEDALGAAVRALGGGGVVAFPTETVFGVGARPDVPEATARLFATKRRSRDLTLPVLAPDAVTAWTVGAASEMARRLAARFWPGSVTIVLPRTERSATWDLGDETDTIAVRVPGHPAAAELLARTGPLAVTSANRSGEPTPPDCDGVREALGDAVDVYLCAGPPPAGTASTVVSVGPDSWTVLREAAVSAREIAGALR